MDRQSPTSIRYSYSNSSATDSIGISRTLEPSPIPEHPSQSANVFPLPSQSSSVPSHYMNESYSAEIHRTAVYESRSRVESRTNLPVSGPSPQLGSSPRGLTAVDRQSYELQIQELKLLLQQQNKELEEHEQLQTKYERCIEQMNSLYQQNDELRSALANRNVDLSDIQISKSYLENSKASQMHKVKQEEIRRLKDSILVLQKQKDSYQEEGNQLTGKIAQLESKNDEYENKLVLVSHELERLNRMIKEKNEEKIRMGKENTALAAEVAQLKQELERLSANRTAQFSQKSSEFTRKVEDLYREVERLNKLKIEMETEIRKLSSENRNKQQEFMMQMEKQRLESNGLKREVEELEARNGRLQDELKNLHEKNSSSQMQLSSVSTQTNMLQMIIKQLEEKLRGLEREYSLQVQKIAGFSHENTELRTSLKVVQEELARTRSLNDRTEQESIQLRRKIQEISMVSERESMSLGENVRQREMALRDCEIRVRDLERQNGLLTEQCRSAESKNQELEAILKQMETRNRESGRQLEQNMVQIGERDKKYRQLESSYEGSLRTIKEWQAKWSNLNAQMQRLNMANNGLISQKNVDESRLRDAFGIQISELEARLNAVNMQKGEMQGKYEHASKEIGRLQQELQLSRNSKAQVDNKLRFAQSAMESLRQQLQFAQQANSSIENQLKSQISLTKELTVKLSKENETQKSQYFTQINKRESFLFEQQQKMQQQQSTISGLQFKVQEKEATIGELMLEIDKYKQQSVHSEHELDSIRSDFTHLVQELEYLKQSNLTKEKAFLQAKEQLAATLNDKEGRLNQKNEEVWRVQAELDKLMEKYRQLERECKEAKEGAIKAGTQARNNAEVNKVLEGELREAQERMRGREKEINQFRLGLQRLEDRYRQVEREYNEAVQAINGTQDQNRSLQRQLTARTQRMQAVQKQLSEQKQVIVQLEQRLRQSQAHRRQLEQQCQLVQSRRVEAAQLIESQYKPLESHYSDLQQQVRQLEGRLREQELDKKKVEYECQQMEQKWVGAEQASVIIRRECDQLGMQCRMLEQQLGQSRAEIQQLQQHNFQLQHSSHQSQLTLQTTQQRILQQTQQYKDTIATLNNRYRNLEQQHNASKETLVRLQQYHSEIEGRSNALEGQLRGLQEKYTEMIGAYKVMERELANLREALRKTEEERVFVHGQREQDENYFREQLTNGDNLVKQLRAQLQEAGRKESEYEDMLRRMQDNINRLEHEHIQLTASHQQKVLSLQQQVERGSSAVSSHIQQIQELTQDNMNFLRTCENLEKELALARQGGTGLEAKLREKEEKIRQMELTINGYMDKINALTREIDAISQQLTQSRLAQGRELDLLLANSNARIQQLETELIDREDYYRRELVNIEADRERRVAELVSKLGQQRNQQQTTIVQLRQQLEQQSHQYQVLATRLQSLLSTNETSFEQVLASLEQILQQTTQLMLSISKSNSTMAHLANSQTQMAQEHHQHQLAEMAKFRNESLAMFDQLRELLLAREEQGRRARDKDDRKDRQDMLDREERIIKYIQEDKERAREDREQASQKHRQLANLIEQNSKTQSETMREATKHLGQVVREEVQGLKGLGESRGSSRVVQQITGNILAKMQNLTSLFLESNSEYKQNIGQLQQTITALQQTNSSLHTQLQSAQHKHLQHTQNYHRQAQALQQQLQEQRHRVALLNQQLQQASQVTFKGNSRTREEGMGRALGVLESELERQRIENAEMRRQYDTIVAQYEKTNDSLTRELEVARREIERLTARTKAQQIERSQNATKNSSHSLNSNSNSNNKTSIESMEGYGHSSREVVDVIEKYQNKIALLSQEIQRLHRVIDSGKMDKRPDRPVRVQGSEAQLQFYRNELDRRIKENQLLKAQLARLDVHREEDRQSQQQAQRLEMMELRHRLTLSQQQNMGLHSQVDKSLVTIQNLMQKVQTVKKSYREMADYAQQIQNKVLGLQGKYNDDLMRKTSFEDVSSKISEGMMNKLELENRSLRDRLHAAQIRGQEVKQEYKKAETIIEALKVDNLSLRKSNYQYEVAVQKMDFLNQKIGKLNEEIDRLTQLNIRLTQELSECRFAIGDESTLERRLFQSYITIVLISAEVEALRSAGGSSSRQNSREGRQRIRLSTEQSPVKDNEGEARPHRRMDAQLSELLRRNSRSKGKSPSRLMP